MRKPFIGTTIAVVIHVVARLRRHARTDNRRQRLRKLHFVRRKIRTRRPTSRRNRIRIRLITTREIDDVRLDLERIRPNRHTRIKKNARRIHRVRLRITRFITVRQQDDVHRTTRSIIRTERRGKCNRAIVRIRPTRLKIPPHIPKRTIERRLAIRRTIRRCICNFYVARTVVIDVRQNLIDVARTWRRTPKIVLLHPHQNSRTSTSGRIVDVIHRTTKTTFACRVEFRKVAIRNTRWITTVIPITARSTPRHVSRVLRQTKVHLARKSQHSVSHRTLRMTHTRRRITARRSCASDTRDHRPRRVHEQHEVRLG